MHQFEATVTLAAAPNAIWEHLCQVERWPQWMDTFTRVRGLDGPELRVGRRFTVEQPRLRAAIWTVTRLEPNAGFTWDSRFPGLHLVADHRLETGAEATLLQLRLTFGGLLGPIFAALLGTRTQDYLQRECIAYRRKLAHARSGQ